MSHAQPNMLPRISVVVPSYNQGEFLEEALQSVLGQGYEDCELIVIDGGSTDESPAILNRYDDRLSYWVSEPDDGQSHAINKGMVRATGSVCGWLCSDDLLEPGSLRAVGEYFADHPDCRWLAGSGRSVHSRREDVVYRAGRPARHGFLAFWEYGGSGRCCPQPSTFWRRDLWQAVGGVRTDRHLAMDYDLWLRFEENASLHTLEAVLSTSRLHDDCKSMRSTREQKLERMRCAYEAAERRGLGAGGLTRAMLLGHWRKRWRMSRRAWNRGWLGGVARNILSIPSDLLLVWSESGRLRLLDRPRTEEPA